MEMQTRVTEIRRTHFVTWNKGRVTGQEPPLKPREVWAIRVRLQISDRVRDLELFNLAIDSKLRGAVRSFTQSRRGVETDRRRVARRRRSSHWGPRPFG